MWVCEAAGLAGMAATLVLCALAYSSASSAGFWIAAAVAIGGNLAYITHVLARRATGNSRLTWRELVLANIVPAVALGVSLVMIGTVTGVFQSPAGAQNTPGRAVISVDKNAEGRLITHTTRAQPD